MTEFADLIWEERRLLMLQLLDSQTEGSAGDRALALGLRAMGHDVAIDQVRTHLFWLHEQRLITVMELKDGALSATVTQRGSDVVRGRSRVAGVMRPDRI